MDGYAYLDRIQYARVVAFVLVVTLVLVGAAGETLLLLRARFRRPPGDPPPGRLRRCVRATLLGLGGLGVACLLYGRFVEPFWPEVTRHRVESPRLRPGTGPVRIVHVTDLHCDPVKRLEDRLVELVAAERPDLIVYTGDSLNAEAALPHFRECMTRLAAIAPTFAVRGNWDVWYWRLLDLFGGTGVRVLDGETETLEVRGARVSVGGAPYGSPTLVGAALDGREPGALRVFLHHTPDIIHQLAREGMDLAFAGHTHGGQVALPGYGALITFSAFDKQFEGGLYVVGATTLYVGRGIGMEGGRAPRVRFWARPEIAVVDVVPAGPR